MKKSVNWRYAVIIALAIVAFLGIFSEPTEVDSWLVMFAISKGVGLLSAWGAYRLNKYWSDNNKIVSML